ncbi:helix-turn-helix domain-containing protein [Actinomyces radicidentis]|uniref:helix-turn-helix transcriptional regulator n=1 Tax=Actinomyces radicidentis TaxID=111015 RepID=UPI0028EEC223|nr:helix-turn-helix domain-containing protein [Actinomyces radicidentis]
MSLTPLLTLEEAASLVGLSASTLRKRAQAGQVPHLKPGGRNAPIRFTEDQVIAIRDAYTVTPTPTTTNPTALAGLSPSSARRIRAI